MAFVQDIYHIRYILQKGKLVFEVSTFGGRYFRENRYFPDLLTLMTFYRFIFGSLATFEGTLLSELYLNFLTS